MENTALANIQNVDQLLPGVDTLKQMRVVADYMVSAKMLPPGYKDGNDLMVVALRGREMGVPLGQAIQGMFPMKGRIGFMGGFLLSRVRQMLPDSSIRVKENTKTRCVLTCQRDKNHSPEDVEFTMEEAIACNYHQNFIDGAWKAKQTWKDPANMLYWRCVSRAINRVFSDVFGSPVYQYDELMDTEPADLPNTEKASASVPYETAATVPEKPVVIEDAEVIPPTSVTPEPPPNETLPQQPEEPPSNKPTQAVIDAIVIAFEKALADCTTKKQVEELFEDFKVSEAKSFPKVLMNAFEMVKNKKKALGGGK